MRREGEAPAAPGRGRLRSKQGVELLERLSRAQREVLDLGGAMRAKQDGLAALVEAEKAWQEFVKAPGHIVVGAVQMASCYGPAYEFAMIMDTDLRRRKIRDKVPMTFVTAEPYIGHLGLGGVGDSKGLMESVMRERHIKWICNAKTTKVEAGKMSLETNNFPLKSLLESSLNMFKEKTIKHGIALELDLDSALAEALIEADERKLKQILFNLLSNAVKFTFDGGVVRLKAEREGEFFKITVTDTGIGIKPEDLGRLFQSFAQLESTYAKQYEGTGLGLALTKKLVELHGGRIWVKSEEGKGSSFIFTIPARPSGQGQQIPETKQQESGRISVKTALVIEDDPLAAQIVETALIFAGFTVTKAVNGRDGLAIAQENSPGLIILDLMLPEMNGFKALAALRAMKETATTPVIVLTAMELSEAEKDGLLAQGVQAVLKKGSLNREEFIATVKRVTG